MNESNRHRQLLNILEKKKIIATSEITELLNVSPATVRRDITKLSQQGKLKKVRNGAEFINNQFNHNSNIHKKYVSNVNEKNRIAEAAAKLCKDKESVILTCGSTMLMLASNLCGRNIQIITNYLPLANYLVEHEHDNVFILGGQYNKKSRITLSLGSISDNVYAANIMFTSSKGITAEGLYKNDMLIANSEQKMLGRVGKLVVLLDSTKLGQRVGMLFCELDKIDLLITGHEADPKIIQELRKKGLEIILA